jgi:hypothetical protein
MRQSTSNNIPQVDYEVLKILNDYRTNPKLATGMRVISGAPNSANIGVINNANASSQPVNACAAIQGVVASSAIQSVAAK